MKSGKASALTSAFKALDRAEKVRRTRDPAQFFDVHNDEIQADPVGTVECIYRYFNLPVSDAARDAWKQRVKDNPKSGHGAHHYQPGDFGFTPQLVYDSVGEYYTRYRAVEKSLVTKR